MFTFRQFLLENIERPKVSKMGRYKQKYNSPGFTHDVFKVTHSKLSRPAHVHVIHNKEGFGEVDVLDHRDHEKGTVRHIGNLGHTNVRHVLGRIKHHLPHLQEISGARITGSHSGEDARHDSDVSYVSMDRIKPIPPGKE